MKKVLLIFLACFLGTQIIAQDLMPMSSDQSSQSLQRAKAVFQSARDTFFKRFSLWQKCIWVGCSDEEKQIAKSDLKLAAQSVMAVGATLLTLWGVKKVLSNREKIQKSMVNSVLETARSVVKEESNDLKQNPTMIIRKMIESKEPLDKIEEKVNTFDSPKDILNARAGTSEQSPHLYTVAIESEYPETGLLIKFLADKGVDISGIHEYRVKKYNVITNALAFNQKDLAAILLSHYNFDWDKDSLRDVILATLVNDRMDDTDSKVFAGVNTELNRPIIKDVIKSIMESEIVSGSTRENIKRHLEKTDSGLYAEIYQ